jgi:hypothetical protein
LRPAAKPLLSIPQWDNKPDTTFGKPIGMSVRDENCRERFDKAVIAITRA